MEKIQPEKEKSSEALGIDEKTFHTSRKYQASDFIFLDSKVGFVEMFIRKQNIPDTEENRLIVFHAYNSGLFKQIMGG